MPMTFEPTAKASNALFRLCIAACVLLAGCGAARFPEPEDRPVPVATVIVSPPAPTLLDGKDTRVTVPGSNESALPMLHGSWNEDFESRSGCRDVINIRQVQSEFVLSGVDCNDKEPYDFQETKFDGQNLDVRVLVTSSGYTLKYHLRLTSPDHLEGHVQVVGGGSTTEYKVKWDRATGEDEP